MEDRGLQTTGGPQSLSFDLDEIECDCENAQKKGGIEETLLKRYRDRKAMATQHSMKNGGYDEERVRANPSEGMLERCRFFLVGCT
ncbi:hypothetical protein R6Q59_006148 [Mikania micrantha]